MVKWLCRTRSPGAAWSRGKTEGGSIGASCPAPSGAQFALKVAGDDLHLQIIDSTQGLLELRESWSELEALTSPGNVFLSWEWQLTWWECFQGDYQLRCLVVRDARELLGIVPLAISNHAPGVLEFCGGPNLSDHLGMLHRPGAEALVAGALLAWLTSSEGPERVLDLHFLPAPSPSLTALRAAAEGSSVTISEELEEVSPFVETEGDFDTYVSTQLNKKDRHELRRKLRRLDQECPGWKMVTQRELGLEPAIDAFFELLRKSGAHKAEFLTVEVEHFIRQACRRADQRGWLRIGLLESDSRLMGATCGFTLGSTWYLYNSGYDPEFSALSPGLLCVAQGVATAISEGCTRADFLRGSEGYKYHLGAKDAPLHRLRLEADPER